MNCSVFIQQTITAKHCMIIRAMCNISSELWETHPIDCRAWKNYGKLKALSQGKKGTNVQVQFRTIN